MGLKKNQIKKEWELLDKREKKFLKRQMETNPSVLQKRLAEKVPEKLQDTLNTAFIKAFGVVFEKGTGIIEKTYNKKQYEQEFEVHTFAASLEKSKKNLRAFSKKAGVSKAKNLLVSGVEGVGLGLLGIGIPDIPIFTAVLLKSIYEIALSYGFPYDSEEEQEFILTVIAVSLMHGDELIDRNRQLNERIKHGGEYESQRQDKIKKAAAALSDELLYMKFLQGLPIVGAVGGAFDVVYLKKITEYADIKYKRRFYENLEKSPYI